MEMSTLLLPAQRALQVMSMDCGATETCLASPGCTHKYLATRWQSFPGECDISRSFVYVCLSVCFKDDPDLDPDLSSDSRMY